MSGEIFNQLKKNKWLILGFGLFALIYLLPYGTGGNAIVVSDGRGVLVGEDYAVFEDGRVLSADGVPLITQDGNPLVVGEIVTSREKKVKRNGEKVTLYRVMTEDDRPIGTEDGEEVFVAGNEIITDRWKAVLVEDGRKPTVSETVPLTRRGKTIIAVTVMAVVFFLTEAVPFPAVAFLIVIGEVIFVGMRPNAVAKSFFSDSVFFIMGSLMIATAIVRQELDKRIGLFILKRTGAKIERVVMGIVATTAVLAAFIADHTVAAMFLPIGVALTVKSGKDLKNLGKLMMFAIAYGAAIGGLGTPSGGARNVIMIEYWRQMYGINISYGQWMLYAFPMVLVMIPITTFILMKVFKPEVRDLSVAMASIEREVGEKGKMTQREWMTALIFLLVLVMWVTVSGQIGLGIVAIIGASLYLIFKLATWDDYNKGVDWGVVLLYAGAISLGLVMKNTGAARWLAENFLNLLAPLGANAGIPLATAVGVLVMAVSNTMSNGAAVAVIAPVTLNMAAISGTSLIMIGFATAISSAFAYLVVVGTPPNAIVFASGYVKASDFIKAGGLLAIASIIVLLIMAMTWWKILGLT